MQDIGEGESDDPVLHGSLELVHSQSGQTMTLFKDKRCGQEVVDQKEAWIGPALALVQVSTPGTLVKVPHIPEHRPWEGGLS